MSQDITCCDRGAWRSSCCPLALLSFPFFLSSSFYPAHRRQMPLDAINIRFIFLEGFDKLSLPDIPSIIFSAEGGELFAATLPFRHYSGCFLIRFQFIMQRGCSQAEDLR